MKAIEASREWHLDSASDGWLGALEGDAQVRDAVHVALADEPTRTVRWEQG